MRSALARSLGLTAAGWHVRLPLEPRERERAFVVAVGGKRQLIRSEQSTPPARERREHVDAEAEDCRALSTERPRWDARAIHERRARRSGRSESWILPLCEVGVVRPLRGWGLT